MLCYATLCYAMLCGHQCCRLHGGGIATPPWKAIIYKAQSAPIALSSALSSTSGSHETQHRHWQLCPGSSSIWSVPSRFSVAGALGAVAAACRYTIRFASPRCAPRQTASHLQPAPNEAKMARSTDAGRRTLDAGHKGPKKVYMCRA